MDVAYRGLGFGLLKHDFESSSCVLDPSLWAPPTDFPFVPSVLLLYDNRIYVLALLYVLAAFEFGSCIYWAYLITHRFEFVGACLVRRIPRDGLYLMSVQHLLPFLLCADRSWISSVIHLASQCIFWALTLRNFDPSSEFLWRHISRDSLSVFSAMFGRPILLLAL
jgi:hypothetical protein